MRTIQAWLRNRWRWVRGLLAYPEFSISLGLLVGATLVVTLMALPFWAKDFDGFLENVVVEGHGLVLDLAALGVLFSIFRYAALQREEQRRAEEQRRTDEQRAEDARQARIARYNEEIDDFRHWQSEEAAFHIAGNIRRLNREGVVPEDLYYVYLQGTMLLRAELLRANLLGANLRETCLLGTNLSEADLRVANLDHANLDNVSLSSANLSSANLNHVNLRGANLSQANLRGANLSQANLRGANLNQANLHGANLFGAYLIGANLWRAYVNEADLARTIYNSQHIHHVVFGKLPPTRWPAGFTPPPDAIDVSHPDHYVRTLLQHPVPAPPAAAPLPALAHD